MLAKYLGRDWLGCKNGEIYEYEEYSSKVMRVKTPKIVGTSDGWAWILSTEFFERFEIVPESLENE